MASLSQVQKVDYIPPPLPPKVRQKQNVLSGSTTVTSIVSSEAVRGAGGASVFIAGGPATEERDAGLVAEQTPLAEHATPRNHVVTIRINTDNEKPKLPSITSVHLKRQDDVTDAPFASYDRKIESLVRFNSTDIQEDNRHEKDGNIGRGVIVTNSVGVESPSPFIYCNSYPLSSVTNMVMSSGQCSPSDTLDSGTCSDLDSTPPPLPKKKISKSNSHKKSVSVTLIGNASADAPSNRNGDLYSEDDESNISCDSLNSSELNGSNHEDVVLHDDTRMNDLNMPPPVPPKMTCLTSNGDSNGFIPQGLLQDIRNRTIKLINVTSNQDEEKLDDSYSEKENRKEQINVNENTDLENDESLDSFQIVSQINNQNKIHCEAQDKKLTSLPVSMEKCMNRQKSPIICEVTYEERQKQKQNSEKISSSLIYDTDKYYTFHLNEKVFDKEDNDDNFNGDKRLLGLKSARSDVHEDSMEYFAGLKDFKCGDMPSTIRSAKGTIRGVKNRVRAGIATFLQMQNTTVKSYREKDAGKVVIYTTTMGIVRSTYQRCIQVKKILRNLLVKFEERDVFMSVEYQDEIRDRMMSDDILVPQLFVDGQHIGDADTVEKLNENGELRKMLKSYKSADACNTCRACGGYRLLPCRVCSGSKKSLHRNHFTAEFVALKCMACDEVGLVRCELCS